ncbi:replication-associated recombination protein A [Alphaproteobacteria bacterium]|nr:replication-associated recombination protein A [Alphaproteobacteria bacterium]
MTTSSDGLFTQTTARPLADTLRPLELDAVSGQDHLLGVDGSLRRMVDAAKSGQPFPSLIFWGSPGTGKTTIARLLADAIGMQFEPVSAVFDGVADLRRVFARAKENSAAGQKTLMFVDEVHRFNKAQQDGLLPHVEDGLVTLVGATTENPSFALNGALLSRCQVMVLNRLDDHALQQIISRAETHYGKPLPLTDDARAMLCGMADGDGRYCLNAVETIMAQVTDASAPLSVDDLGHVLSRRAMAFDRAGDQHYNLMSVLHKSLRSSDADAALYWFARMVIGGEDIHYILRRLTRFAAEDIGLAEPDAVPRAIASWNSFERLGSPEGELSVAQLILYLATAPKSNAVYAAYNAAMRAARDTGSLSPPAHMLNAPTGLMKELGYGQNYVYDHDTPDGFSGQSGFPDDMARQRFYYPAERGFEREVQKRLDWWAKRREQKGKSE